MHGVWTWKMTGSLYRWHPHGVNTICSRRLVEAPDLCEGGQEDGARRQAPGGLGMDGGDEKRRRPQEPGLLRGLVGRTGSVQLALCSLRLSKRPGNASVAMLSR
jgi:hypothetical protein